MAYNLDKINMITFKNISLYYGQEENRITALNNINLTLNEGEYISLLGANGSGKSTLARLINGLISPSSGTVSVDSLSTVDPDEKREIRSKVGFVFQNPDNQIVASTVEEDVAFGPENLGLPSAEIENRVKDALELVGMLRYAKHEPHMLSGGQKQRVAIAGALAMRTKYLILDEATSMLDTKGSEDVAALLKVLNRRCGLTVLSITHRPEEAVKADRVIVLDSGEIAVDGTPHEVFTDADRLKSYKVAVPRAKLLAELLKDAGAGLPGDILTVEELVDALC
jgi:energy-coupling factor transport system ATP-binding protein